MDLLIANPLKQTLVVAPFVLLVVWRFWTRRHASRLPLPPGPSGYPIVGNLLDMVAPGDVVRHYSNLAKQHGDIFLLESLGSKVMILSSLKRTNDLFEKRSNIYSDRPWLPMLCGEMKYDENLSIMPYSPMWRKQRREFHSHFNQSVLDVYHPVILDERAHLLKDLLAHPSEYSKHTKTYFTSIVIRVTYGVKPKSLDDPLVLMPNVSNEGFRVAGRTGGFLVDLIPWLTYVPEWMPGAGWKKVAQYYRDMARDARIVPFKQVQERYKQGTATACIATRMLDNLPDVDDPNYEEAFNLAQDTSGQVYGAASDTSFSIGIAFFLMLVMYPEVQKRAQKEIDEVVGSGRLPDFNDRAQLVYVEALIMELLRWHQPAPLGVPHATSEDDVYEGYFIPKGTVVFGNMWYILHNPETYPDPFNFKPERFIKDGKFDKEAASQALETIFGFGRRACPGRLNALDNLYPLIVSVLAVFNVSVPKDANGNPDIKPSFNTGMIVRPDPFECSITPRSERHKDLIQSLLVSDVSYV